ncbi:KilA-N domain-containing protein [Pseudomonas chlororaphis]|uniref:KilA-N domain-containing protein n=1 Tax=Pseudomonas chlororaphis TaxID=587753 RepID=UPI00069225CC|nr:KilA-N domain-containing protein [Pseudomonas chlororaphis]
MNSINIRHKHADHLIIIEGQSFKANDAGMWNLTDIWQTLKLPKTKRPSRWRDKDAKAMERIHNLDTVGDGATPVTKATKRAALKYAAWVSPEFETMVYDAFEAVLEMPEVAQLVAEKMRFLGHDQSAAILERHVFNERCDWTSTKRSHKNTQRGLRAAVKLGHLTPSAARSLGLKAI